MEARVPQSPSTEQASAAAYRPIGDSASPAPSASAQRAASSAPGQSPASTSALIAPIGRPQLPGGASAKLSPQAPGSAVRATSGSPPLIRAGEPGAPRRVPHPRQLALPLVRAVAEPGLAVRVARRLPLKERTQFTTAQYGHPIRAMPGNPATADGSICASSF